MNLFLFYNSKRQNSSSWWTDVKDIFLIPFSCFIGAASLTSNAADESWRCCMNSRAARFRLPAGSPKSQPPTSHRKQQHSPLLSVELTRFSFQAVGVGNKKNKKQEKQTLRISLTLHTGDLIGARRVCHVCLCRIWTDLRHWRVNCTSCWRPGRAEEVACLTSPEIMRTWEFKIINSIKERNNSHAVWNI